MFDLSADTTLLEPVAVDGDILNGIVRATIVTHGADGSGSRSAPVCQAYLRSLKRRQVPKFATASGWRLSDVPEELAQLNPMEARMIGLGLCFTTCYRLRGDGQEGTHGNSISYWNDACEIAKKLPRPLRRSGVVQVRTHGRRDKKKFFDIRPNLLRQALRWLIDNNPLYADVTIDEDVLQSLELETSADNVPEIEVEEDPNDTERSNANEQGKFE